MISKLTFAITSRKYWIRQIVVASLSAGVAFTFGNSLGGNGGVVAAIVSTLTIRVSLHRSLREGIGQIIGTTLGAAVSLVTVSLFGFGPIAIAGTVFVCAILARAFRLGDIASVNVPVVAMIVISPGLSENTVLHRLLVTCVGAAVAIFFSFFSHPKTPIDRTYDLINKLGLQGSDLLAEMSEGIAAGYSQSDASHWLGRARALVRRLPELRSQINDARGYSKWIRKGQRSETDRASLESLAVEHCLVQIRVIARTLFDSSLEAGIEERARKELAVALSAASFALGSHIEDREADSTFDTSPTDDLRQATHTLSQVLLQEGVERAHAVKGLSVVAQLEVIADSLDLKSPALNDRVD